jgi:hypothetical protein
MGSILGNRKGSVPVTDLADIFGFARVDLSISSSAAQTAALPEGRYDIWSDIDCFIKISTDATTGLTTSTGYLLRANNTVTFFVRDDHKIGAVTASASGTLSAHRVG